jgi:hypothetical protein
MVAILSKQQRNVRYVLTWLLWFGASAVAPSTPEPQYVSMVELLANPSSYDGKRVALSGYLYIKGNGEDDAVFLHKEDRENWLASNSIWVVELRPEFRASLPGETYAEVVGTFRVRSAATSHFYQSGTILLESATPIAFPKSNQVAPRGTAQGGCAR